MTDEEFKTAKAEIDTDKAGHATAALLSARNALIEAMEISPTELDGAEILNITEEIRELCKHIPERKAA